METIKAITLKLRTLVYLIPFFTLNAKDAEIDLGFFGLVYVTSFNPFPHIDAF